MYQTEKKCYWHRSSGVRAGTSLNILLNNCAIRQSLLIKSEDIIHTKEEMDISWNLMYGFEAWKNKNRMKLNSTKDLRGTFRGAKQTNKSAIYWQLINCQCKRKAHRHANWPQDCYHLHKDIEAVKIINEVQCCIQRPRVNKIFCKRYRTSYGGFHAGKWDWKENVHRLMTRYKLCTNELKSSN